MSYLICNELSYVNPKSVTKSFDLSSNDYNLILGYVLAGYKDPVPLVEAIRVGIVAEMAGTRLLNAQCCTGGLVDPAFGYRVPLEVAKQKGLVDNRVLGLLNPTSEELKGYTDPSSGKNATYEELVKKCTKRNNVLLLPIEDRDPTVHMHQMIFN